jgi:ribosomal protein S18 acetylase RimI-like enzyme
MTFSIRPAQPADAPTLISFNIAMALETENLQLAPDIIGPGVRAALADPAKALYFVAETAGQVVGQLMITTEWSDWRNADVWWIQSVYVHPDHRRRGVFKALFEHVEQLARRHHIAALRLYVEKENLSAQGTYERLGMHLSHYRLMEKTLK